MNMLMTRFLLCLPPPQSLGKLITKYWDLDDKLTDPCGWELPVHTLSGLLPTRVFDEVTVRLYSGQRAI